MRRAYLFGLICLLVVGLTGCKHHSTLSDKFSFEYSMESFHQYKVSYFFDSERNYKSEVCNYNMDNFEKKQRPKVHEGKLSDTEFEKLRDMLDKANIPAMEEHYGFDQDQRTYDIIIQLMLEQNNTKKYVEIQYDENQKFKKDFLDFITELNKSVKN
ncbi:MAG: hypothetical protein ACTTJK_11250 [Phocaeicola sp.]|uniref:hypothetical protein n=1 Tax=Phocaeicola sp. TaxID=2773926 RepID=UPI003FA1362D